MKKKTSKQDSSKPRESVMAAYKDGVKRYGKVFKALAD